MRKFISIIYLILFFAFISFFVSLVFLPKIPEIPEEDKKISDTSTNIKIISQQIRDKCKLAQIDSKAFVGTETNLKITYGKVRFSTDNNNIKVSYQPNEENYSKEITCKRKISINYKRSKNSRSIESTKLEKGEYQLKLTPLDNSRLNITIENLSSEMNKQ